MCVQMRKLRKTHKCDPLRRCSARGLGVGQRQCRPRSSLSLTSSTLDGSEFGSPQLPLLLPGSPSHPVPRPVYQAPPVRRSKSGMFFTPAPTRPHSDSFIGLVNEGLWSRWPMQLHTFTRRVHRGGPPPIALELQGIELQSRPAGGGSAPPSAQVPSK